MPRDLVAEFKSSGPTYQRTVKATLRSSYTNHYRAGLIKLLSVLEVGSNNTTHRPVLDALELIGKCAGANLRYYPAGRAGPDAPRDIRGLGGAGVSGRQERASAGGADTAAATPARRRRRWSRWCTKSVPPDIAGTAAV